MLKASRTSVGGKSNGSCSAALLSKSISLSSFGSRQGPVDVNNGLTTRGKLNVILNIKQTQITTQAAVMAAAPVSYSSLPGSPPGATFEPAVASGSPPPSRQELLIQAAKAAEKAADEADEEEEEEEAKGDGGTQGAGKGSLSSKGETGESSPRVATVNNNSGSGSGATSSSAAETAAAASSSSSSSGKRHRSRRTQSQRSDRRSSRSQGAELEGKEEGEQEEAVQGEEGRRTLFQILTGRTQGLAPVPRLLAGGGALLLFSTLLVALRRVQRRAEAPGAQRSRQVSSNARLVGLLGQYLPRRREALTRSAAQEIQRKCHCTAVEAFRKFLWFLLRERPFDEEAILDLVKIKEAFAMTDEEVVEAIKERAQRVYDKYGNVMLDTEGMSSKGVERKASCVSLFRRLLYLSECGRLLPPGEELDAARAVKAIFGALPSDIEKIRIRSLYEGEVDLEHTAGLSVAKGDALSSVDLEDALPLPPPPPPSGRRKPNNKGGDGPRR